MQPAERPLTTSSPESLHASTAITSGSPQISRLPYDTRLCHVHRKCPILCERLCQRQKPAQQNGCRFCAVAVKHLDSTLQTRGREGGPPSSRCKACQVVLSVLE